MRAQRIEATGEHDYEPVRGLPGPLPAGEHLIWQGSPDWRGLAVQAFHLRKVALYFGLLLAWRFIGVLADGGSLLDGASALLFPLPRAAAGLGLLAGLAWLSARTTVYTLTNRRVVMRVGMVLSVSFNLPLSRIEAAALRPRANGLGDITLRLQAPQRIAYLHLWPHAKPWALKRTEPMLRAVSGAQGVAQQLSAALGVTLADAPVVPATAAVPAAPAGPRWPAAA